ncbi:hypothetical protein B0H10DRAFT_1993381 [Mycena sp. CBHHK59/15]|nr:hypothetical protein B0H10DRAFT_1993381 [Mycena sp. CBHHK59/15]
MLVDSHLSPPSLFAPPYADYSNDLNDIFHTELFALSSSSATASSPASSSSGSRESTPHVLTPRSPLYPPPSPTFFNFLDEDVKALDPLSMLSSAPYDFFGGAGSIDMGGATMSDLMGSGDMMSGEMMGIDPQLVGSPAPAVLSDFDSEHSSSPASSTSPNSNATTSPEADAPAPVKVGGHGKARKGTVQSGGIAKRPAAVPNKENASSLTAVTANNHAAFMPSTTFKPRGNSKGEDEEDDDDLPADWRPPPEVFQKMSSKEKRQLRNKISARNFRVRRKEYISTLEDNIAERDRLLSAIRSELGSTQSENHALRQEIAALKRTLLDNRGPAPVLPPPAPLSAASPTLAATSPKPTSSLPRANTHKDVAGSSRFWGGAVPAPGGYTSVHTARIPDLLASSPFALPLPASTAAFAASGFAPSPFVVAKAQAPHGQQENLNPALNGAGPVAEVLRSGMVGADAFGDANPFTVRSLDAYRMHLWGRMAAQYRYNKEHPAPSSSSSAPTTSFNPSAKAHSPPHSPPFGPLSGLASGLRPKYFASPLLPYASPLSSYASSSSLSLSLSGKGTALQKEREREREREREKERERAMYAALASQTLLKRLGGAFWDAFSGSPSASSSSSGNARWDAEKVRKVLEGKAVVRVVDVEAAPTAVRAPAPVIRAASPVIGASAKTSPVLGAKTSPSAKACSSSERDKCRITDMLEESMRSLSLGKKM